MEYVVDKKVLKKIIGEDTIAIIPGNAKQIKSNVTIEAPLLEELVIPGTVELVDENAFCNNKKIKRVKIEEGVQKLGFNCFANCIELEIVELPGSLKKIGCVFSNCPKLKTVILHEGIEIIDNATFSDCKSLEEIILPNSLITLGSHVFRYSGIKSIKFPKKLETIGEGCFLETPLESIEFSDSIKEILNTAFSCCNLSGEIILPKGLKRLGSKSTFPVFSKDKTIYDGVFSYNPGITKCVLSDSIEEIEGNPVLGTGVTDIILPKNLKKIGGGVFYKSNITHVDIPESVTSIGSSAFSGCKNLEHITLPKGLVIIGNFAFCASGLQELIIPDTVTEIGNGAIAQTNITEISIPAGVTAIGSQLFQNCQNLKKVNLPAGIKSIDWQAFAFTPIEEIDLPESITSIKPGAFYKTMLKAIKLPESLLQLGDISSEDDNRGGVFQLSTLETINLPEGLEYIDVATFKDTPLKEITIPKNVKIIGRQAFMNCKNLEELVIPEGVTEVGGDMLNGSGVKKVYLPDSITTIPGNFLANAENLSEVRFPKKCTIESNSFINSGLEYLHVPASVKKLECAFTRCKRLHTIEFDSIACSINDFRECPNLKHIKISAKAKVPSEIKWRQFDCQFVEDIELDPKNKELMVSEDKKCLLAKDGKTLLLSLPNAKIPETVNTIINLNIAGTIAVVVGGVIRDSKINHLKISNPEITDINSPIRICSNGYSMLASGDTLELGPGMEISYYSIRTFDRVIFNSRYIEGLDAEIDKAYTNTSSWARDSFLERFQNKIFQAPYFDPRVFSSNKLILPRFIQGFAYAYRDSVYDESLLDAYKEVINNNIQDCVDIINKDTVFQTFIMENNIISKKKYTYIKDFINTENQEFNIYLLGLSESDMLSFDDDDEGDSDEIFVNYTLNIEQTSDTTCKIASVRNAKIINDEAVFIIPEAYNGLTVTEIEPSIFNGYKRLNINFKNTSIHKLNIISSTSKECEHISIQAPFSLEEVSHNDSSSFSREIDSIYLRNGAITKAIANDFRRMYSIETREDDFTLTIEKSSTYNY